MSYNTASTSCSVSYTVPGSVYDVVPLWFHLSAANSNLPLLFFTHPPPLSLHQCTLCCAKATLESGVSHICSKSSICSHLVQLRSDDCKGCSIYSHNFQNILWLRALRFLSQVSLLVLPRCSFHVPPVYVSACWALTIVFCFLRV